MCTGEEVTEGTAQFEVRGRGGMSFFHFKKAKNLCGLLPNGCPVSKGDITISYSIGNHLTAMALAVS